MSHFFHKLSPVEKTALESLWCRTYYFRHFTEKPDTLAEKIISEINYVSPDSNAKGVIADYRIFHLGRRAARIDELTREFLKHFPKALVVNVGCGMETFLERIDNDQIRGLSVDLKNLIHLRQRLNLSNSDRLSSLAVNDLIDLEWLQSLDDSQGILFVIAGVTPYLNQEDNLKLLDAIRTSHPKSQVIMDYYSPIGVYLTNRTMEWSSHVRVYFQSGWTKRMLTDKVANLCVIRDEDLGCLSFMNKGTKSLSLKCLTWLSKLTRFSRLIHFSWRSENA